MSLVVGIELIVLLGYAGYTVQVITDINGTTLAYDDEWSQDQQYFFRKQVRLSRATLEFQGKVSPLFPMDLNTNIQCSSIIVCRI